MYPNAINRLIQEFAKLPGIGEKTAERLAFYLIHQSKDEAMKLALAIKDLKDGIKICSTCCNVSSKDPCEVCSDNKRDRRLICVVEETKDLWSIEKSQAYNGLYHVLHGRIAPLDGLGPSDLTIKKLIERVKKEHIQELIIATNPTVEGDATAYYIQSQFKELDVEITRIAKGIPVGATIEYVSKFTICDALKGRTQMSASGGLETAKNKVKP